MDGDVDRIWTSLETEPGQQRFSNELVVGLPAPAQRYFLHVIAPGTPLASSVALTMTGHIKAGTWMRFTAKQILRPERGFVWKVKARWGPFVITGMDSYFEGEGRTVMKIFGVLALVNAGGSNVSKSAVGRLAGESLFVPSSLLSRDVRWHGVDDERATVDVVVDGETSVVTLSIDSDGRPREVFLKRWGNQTDGGEYDYIPFGVTFDDERAFGGYTIPTRLRAGWWYGTERYTEFFRAEILRAEFT